ncbi:TQO small subunit DoxD [Mycobacterium sp. E3247]|uniref:TQO small subunit DoxD n=1 Tax=Mycobacterium sp. E3247 TaxID=1856864 RepID=UPI0008019087|nr:TQO small subunit DoxD [Mycobacterium sp. E3247]OBH18767.1 quinol oxidase [Mycobacterium sp. E3247]
MQNQGLAVSPSTQSSSAALILLPLRLVVGWTYFSAFWRRAILADKLDPSAAGYVGEKFNNFLPNALGIKPVINYLVLHPDILKWSMIAFTMVEALVGLCLMLGIFTRAMGASALLLAFGILLSAGWLGTTCLDEWQIGILGIASGVAFLLGGGGEYSVDALLRRKGLSFTRSKRFTWLASGESTVSKRAVIIGAAAVLAVTLVTNQYFHGGVYGPLHNKSIKPVVEISDASIADGGLRFTVYRTEGVDVYGSFLVSVALVDDGKTILKIAGPQLSQLPKSDIVNYHVAAVKPGTCGLVIPLGAKARISLNTGAVAIDKNRSYALTLTDVSGVRWQIPVTGG